MIDFYDDNCFRPDVKVTDTGHFSIYEKLNYLWEKVKEVVGITNSFQEQIDTKESKENLTNVRLLSETGDFTGTWFGESKASINEKLSEGENNYNTLINYLIANPQIAYNIWDGGFFLTPVTGETLDGGEFGEPNINEYDCGQFVYPCTCIPNYN